MKLFVITLLAVAASADRLENNYLPPTNARAAGGLGNILVAPYRREAFKFQGASHSEGISNFAPVVDQYQKTTYGQSAPVAILRFDNQNNGDGSYQFQYETENKISQQESGQLRNAGSQDEGEEVHGSYSYISPEGQQINVQYVADENGFQPSGDHLPTPPPVPEAILKSLELNARPGGSDDDGQYHASNDGNYQEYSARQYLAPKTAANNRGYHY